uniref:Uncharacterized protein n=1 Tax=Knipowitschia caucasica TaxID=637954 RepID=A0AAV2LDS6_KNICA
MPLPQVPSAGCAGLGGWVGIEAPGTVLGLIRRISVVCDQNELGVCEETEDRGCGGLITAGFLGGGSSDTALGGCDGG